MVAPGRTVAQAARVGGHGTTRVTQAQETTAHEAEGRLYEALRYAPEVGRWVKSVEEYDTSGGVRNERDAEELESFRPAARAAPAPKTGDDP